MITGIIWAVLLLCPLSGYGDPGGGQQSLCDKYHSRVKSFAAEQPSDSELEAIISYRDLKEYFKCEISIDKYTASYAAKILVPIDGDVEAAWKEAALPARYWSERQYRAKVRDEGGEFVAEIQEEENRLIKKVRYVNPEKGIFVQEDTTWIKTSEVVIYYSTFGDPKKRTFGMKLKDITLNEPVYPFPQAWKEFLESLE